MNANQNRTIGGYPIYRLPGLDFLGGFPDTTTPQPPGINFLLLEDNFFYLLESGVTDFIQLEG